MFYDIVTRVLYIQTHYVKNEMKNKNSVIFQPLLIKLLYIKQEHIKVPNKMVKKH